MGGAKVKGSPTVGELLVAPDFLPDNLAGDYWVVAYDEGEGYALISSGAPDTPSGGKCKSEGLWIFTRDWQRDNTLVETVRDIADSLGFDTDVLNTIVQDQVLCGWP